MSQYTAQILLVIFLIFDFTPTITSAFAGRQAEKPTGLIGFLSVIAMACFIVYVFVVAGAFSKL